MYNSRSLHFLIFAGFCFLNMSCSLGEPEKTCQSDFSGTQDSQRYSMVGNLTMCAMIRDEIAYIVEWIEHYRLQGVDRFLLYDDGSRDNTVLLTHLYQTKGFADFVEVYPNNHHTYNKEYPQQVSRQYVWRQIQALQHCNSRSINRTKWVIVVDVDEFVYSPQNGSIWDFIQSKSNETEFSPLRPLNETVSEFYITGVRYGTSGMQKDFGGNIYFDPYSGHINFVADIQNVNSSTVGALPMIMQMNPNRAPHDQLDADFDERFNQTCRNHDDPDDCTHALGKSIWKPERCNAAYVHWCKKLKGSTYDANIEELQENHYAFKSKEHVEKLIGLMKPLKKAAYDQFDVTWFSSRWDPMPKHISEAVMTALNKFQAIQ
jgi:Glycosyltransferase family 92